MRWTESITRIRIGKEYKSQLHICRFHLDLVQIEPLVFFIGLIITCTKIV